MIKINTTTSKPKRKKKVIVDGEKKPRKRRSESSKQRINKLKDEKTDLILKWIVTMKKIDKDSSGYKSARIRIAQINNQLKEAGVSE